MAGSGPITTALALAALALTGCSETSTVDGDVGIPNPASEHCIDQGGRLDIRDGEGGQFGVCVFDDGSECEEWAFYRGECQPGGG